MALGAAPFVAALALYNAHFFGSPLRWGYEAALGPAAGPGFGVDPWGNAYVLERDGADVRVSSCGPDGQDGTDDDIVWPEEER